MFIALEEEKLLLRKLLKETKYITPILDEKYGYRFPRVEQALGKTPEEVKEILEKLTEEGFLKKHLYAVVRGCVYCNKQNFTVIEKCPECNSRRIESHTIIQHINCGYSGAKSEFESKEKLICPFCGRELKSISEYKVLGYWYKCLECDASFSEPVHALVCLNCKNENSLEESIIKSIYEYEIVEEKVLREIPSLESERIKELFGENWLIKIPSIVNGKSGISHTFTATLIDKENSDLKLNLDISLEREEVGEEVITRFYAKAVDTEPENSILIVIPKLSNRAKRIAETLRVKVFEADNLEEGLIKVKDYLINRVSSKG